jgi:Bifunctional DNA primase/polymerase, N-terminal
MSIPDEIERVALLGWHVYPQSNYGRAACFEGAHAAATADLDTISGWSRAYPACNWRVVCGPSRIWGLDLDVPPLHLHDGIANFAKLAAEHSPLPRRPQMRSGGGGLAIFFAHAGEPIRGRAGVPVPGADPRRERQTQTIPPSRHHSTGKPYYWITAPWETSPPSAPDWLLASVRPPAEPPPKPAVQLVSGDAARNYAVGALYQAVRRVGAAGKGTRNDTLNAETYALARFVLTGALGESEVRDALYAAAQASGLTGDDGARSALMTIDSGLKSRRRA